MLPFRLTCFGPPSLSGPDGEPIRFRTKKHLALLIYLTTEPPIAHRRERIASLLWPQADTEEGRHSLATGLSMLRGRLGSDAFDGTRDTIRLLAGRVVSDVAELIAEDRSDFTNLPSGDFLADFEISGAVDFGHWVDSQRARLLPIIYERLTRQIGQCKRTGDARLMEELGEQLRRLDPLSEEATRALLEARAMAGDRIGSLRVFETWRAKLAEELGASPTPDLEQLAERLRRHRYGRGAHTPLAIIPVMPSRNCTFVGRTQDFRACYDVWMDVRKGAGRHVLVIGESGIGKSALAGRVCTSLAIEGATVVRTQCHALERELPFVVIGNLVEQLIDVPGSGGTAPDQLAELGRLVATVRLRWPDLPRPSEVSGENARVQFTYAVHALVACITFERPVVIFIDDIHFADATSLAVLHALLRRTESLPLMVLATSIGTGTDMPPSILQLTRPHSPLRVTAIELGPLSDGEGQDLLSSLVANGADPGPTVRRALLSGAQGNPMALELLVSDWQRSGSAALALSPGAMTRSAPSQRTNASLRTLVTTAISILDDDCRAVINLAAVLGRRLNDLRFYALVDLSIRQTMRAMTVLTSHKFLRDVGSHLEFTNAIVRGECYEAMAASLRQMLHSVVADALTAEPRGPAHVLDLEIAWHLVRGDRLSEAVRYLIAGGQASIQAGAPHEADLALSTGIPALSGRDRGTAVLLLSEALQELGRWQDSLLVLDTPCEAFELSDECWRDALRIVGKRWSGTLSDADIRAGIDRMIDITRSPCAPPVRAKAAAAAIRLLTISRDESRIEMLADVLDSVSTVVQTPYDRLHLMLAQAWTLNASNRPDAALSCLNAGVHLAAENGFKSSITVRLLVGLGNTLSVLGRYREAVEPLVEAEGIAKQLDNETLVGECSTQLAVAFGRLGERSAQINWARRASHRFPVHDQSPGAIGATYELGVGLALEGRSVEAKAVASDLLARSPFRETTWLRQAALLCAADILALAGHPKRASRLARAGLIEGDMRLLNQSYAGQYARWVAQTAVEDQDPESGLMRLSSEFPSPSALHAKDRTELLAARAYLLQLTGVTAKVEWDVVREELAVLPPGISMAIRVMGLHPDQQPQF